jgi:hypothetical protein
MSSEDIDIAERSEEIFDTIMKTFNLADGGYLTKAEITAIQWGILRALVYMIAPQPRWETLVVSIGEDLHGLCKDFRQQNDHKRH